MHAKTHETWTTIQVVLLPRPMSVKRRNVAFDLDLEVEYLLLQLISGPDGTERSRAVLGALTRGRVLPLCELDGYSDVAFR